MSTTTCRAGLASVLLAWLRDVRHRRDVADTTLQLYERVVRTASRWCAAAPDAPSDLFEFVRDRERRIAPRTLALEVSVLRIGLGWGVARGVLAESVLDLPRIRVDPRVYQICHTTPSPGEVGRVVEVLAEDDWRVAIVLLARTGARVGEITSLRGRDLDVERGLLALGATPGARKTGLRWFPLDAETVALLGGRERRDDEPLLDFQGRRDPREGIRHRLMRACERAGVPRFTPHGLRRMVVGRLMRAGVDPAVAAALTGHSVSVMLRLYREVTLEDRRAAARRARLGVLEDGPGWPEEY